MKFLEKHGDLIQAVLFSGLGCVSWLGGELILASIATLASTLGFIVYYMKRRNDKRT